MRIRLGNIHCSEKPSAASFPKFKKLRNFSIYNSSFNSAVIKTLVVYLVISENSRVGCLSMGGIRNKTVSFDDEFYFATYSSTSRLRELLNATLV